MQINGELANGKEAFFFNWNTWTGCQFLSPCCQLPLNMTYWLTHCCLSCDHRITLTKTVDRRCSCDIVIFWHHFKIKTTIFVSHTWLLCSLPKWERWSREDRSEECTRWEKRREGQGQWIRRELEAQLRLTSSLCSSRFPSPCLPSSPLSLFSNFPDQKKELITYTDCEAKV